jgi:hypothetical protein
LLTPNSLVVLISRSEDQAAELFREHLLVTWEALGCPLKRRKPNTLELRLNNGSRIVVLAHSPDTSVGKSNVRLLIIDEAARVSDEVYGAVSPFLAVSNGTLMLLSTPKGKRGFFWRAWDKETHWEKTRITAWQCPRISREFLDEERRTKGDRYFKENYECSFEDAVGAAFSEEAINAMVSVGGTALFG